MVLGQPGTLGLPVDEYDAFLVVNHNVRDKGPVEIHVVMHVVPPALCPCPNIGVDPSSFAFNLPPDSDDVSILNITNTGDVGSELKFEISSEDSFQTAGVEAQHAGGPDAFGYVYRDSDQGGSPFDWFDISAAGAPLALGDNTHAEIPMPFPMHFYGVLAHSGDPLFVSSNGYACFLEAGTDTADNVNIPKATNPNACIFAFWDDLDPSLGGEVYFYYDAPTDRYIIQWTDVPLAGDPTTAYTFQIILKPGGSIHTQYLEMAGPTDGASIGIENPDGTIGLQVNYNTPYVHGGLAVSFKHWLELGPQVGLVPANVQPVDIGVNTVDMPAGTSWHADVRIDHNVPNVPVVIVPVDLNVTSVCQLEYFPDELTGWNISMAPDSVAVFFEELFNSGDLDCNWTLADNPVVPEITVLDTLGTLLPGEDFGASFEVNTTGHLIGDVIITNLDLQWNPAVLIPVTITVEEVASVVVPPLTVGQGQATIPVDVLNISGDPNTEGLGAFLFELWYDPFVAQADTVLGGTAPFDSPPTFNIDNINGVVSFTALQTNIPGPTGDINVASVVLNLVGPSESCTYLDILVVDLFDVNANTIPNIDEDGELCLQAPTEEADTGYFTSTHDAGYPLADHAAGITAAIYDVHDLGTGTPDPTILLGGYQAEATYNGDLLNVLEVALQPPFESGTYSIDNPAGVTAFNAIAPLGVSWPIDPLAFLKLRLVGCVLDETVLTLNFIEIIDVNGNYIAMQQPPEERVFRRGDAKADGVINIGDALYSVQTLVGTRSVGDDPVNQTNLVNAASVKHDDLYDSLTVADVLQLMQYLVGLRNECFQLVQQGTAPAGR